jgi:Exostosin family
MNIYIASASDTPPATGPAAVFKRIADIDRYSIHHIVDDYESADVILFADSHLLRGHALKAITKSSLLKRFPERCMTYDERDNPWCALPGIYVSMPREWFDDNAQRAWGYYTLNSNTAGDPTIEPDILYSFVGSLGNQVSKGRSIRTNIMGLVDDRSFLRDTSGFVFYDDHGNPEAHRAQQHSFAKTMERSKFILCPRGAGTSSIRTYEALRSGRVPVIISDDWVEPKGPDWASFTVRIRDADVKLIPDILRSYEPDWQVMAQNALTAFTQWFEEDVTFHHMAEQCHDLLINGARVNRALAKARLTQIQTEVRKQKLRNVVRRLLVHAK